MKTRPTPTHEQLAIIRSKLNTLLVQAFADAGKNLIRKALLNRWTLGAVAVSAVAGVISAIWGVMGLAGLAGAAVGLGLPLLFGTSKPWTAEDQAEHDRRWKWDGSTNDDGLNN